MSNCPEHSGHIEKINSSDSKMVLITWLLGILIGLSITINSGVFIVLWNMNSTLTVLNTKTTIYDKVFEDKIKIPKDKS
jgi:hypothetical protein